MIFRRYGTEDNIKMDSRVRVYEAPMCSNWLWLNVISWVISSTGALRESTVTSRHKYDKHMMNRTAHKYPGYKNNYKYRCGGRATKNGSE